MRRLHAAVAPLDRGGGIGGGVVVARVHVARQREVQEAPERRRIALEKWFKFECKKPSRQRHKRQDRRQDHHVQQQRDSFRVGFHQRDVGESLLQRVPREVGQAAREHDRFGPLRRPHSTHTDDRETDRRREKYDEEEVCEE